MVIIFQQQLLMHSNPVFWLNSYHVIASNTAKNLVPVIQIGKIAPACVDATSSDKAHTFHYSEQYLKKISNFKRDLVNIQ